MNINNYVKRIRREMYKALSRFCFKQTSTNYFGLKLRVPLIHGLGAGFLVADDKWMSDCLSVFLKLKQGAVIDVGVNIGLYLVKLKALNSQREYIGFEPNAVCNNYTQELVRANNFKNVRILPFALSNKKELRSFYIRRKADKMGSLNDYARFGETDKFSFDLFTFPADEFIQILSPENICAFKVDVEGAELEVLQGLSGTLQKYKPFLYCEIWQLPTKDHPTHDEKKSRLEKICHLLNEIDYKILGVSADNSKVIDILDTVDMFNEKYRRDYILVHKSDVEILRDELVKLSVQA